MRNKEKWQPTIFLCRNKELLVSKNTEYVGLSSRLICSIIGKLYTKYIPMYAKGRLLDLGCGNVPYYEMYKDYVDDNICIDWESTYHKNQFLDYAFDLNKPLPIENEQFDSIILSDVLEHIRYPEVLLKEMYRLLKPGGKAIINVPFYYWLHEHPYDYFRYTRYALESMVKEANLKIVILESTGGTPEILADIIAKNVQHLRVIGRFCAVAVQSFTRWFVATGLGKKISNATKGEFPLGYFIVCEKV